MRELTRKFLFGSCFVSEEQDLHDETLKFGAEMWDESELLGKWNFRLSLRKNRHAPPTPDEFHTRLKNSVYSWVTPLMGTNFVFWLLDWWGHEQIISSFDPTDEPKRQKTRIQYLCIYKTTDIRQQCVCVFCMNVRSLDVLLDNQLTFSSHVTNMTGRSGRSFLLKLPRFLFSLLLSHDWTTGTFYWRELLFVHH